MRVGRETCGRRDGNRLVLRAIVEGDVRGVGEGQHRVGRGARVGGVGEDGRVVGRDAQAQVVEGIVEFGLCRHICAIVEDSRCRLFSC